MSEKSMTPLISVGKIDEPPLISVGKINYPTYFRMGGGMDKNSPEYLT